MCACCAIIEKKAKQISSIFGLYACFFLNSSTIKYKNAGYAVGYRTRQLQNTDQLHIALKIYSEESH